MGCLRWLLKVKSALSWECGGNAKSLVSAIESQAGLHAVNGGKASEDLCFFWPKKWWGIWINWLINLSTFSDHHIIPRIRGFPSLSDSLTGGDSVGRGAGISWDWNLYPMGIQYLNITHISHIYHTFPIPFFRNHSSVISVSLWWRISRPSQMRLIAVFDCAVAASSCWLRRGCFFSVFGTSDWWTPLGWFCSTSKSDESDGFLLIPEIE